MHGSSKALPLTGALSYTPLPPWTPHLQDACLPLWRGESAVRCRPRKGLMPGVGHLEASHLIYLDVWGWGLDGQVLFLCH